MTLLLLPKEAEMEEGTSLGIVKRNIAGRLAEEAAPEDGTLLQLLLPFDEMCSPLSWLISSSMRARRAGSKTSLDLDLPFDLDLRFFEDDLELL